MDWKIILAIILGFIVFFAGTAKKIGFEELTERVRDVVDKVIGEKNLPTFFSVPVNRNLTISSQFTAENQTFRFEEIKSDTITINLEEQTSKITAGGNLVNLSRFGSANLSIKNFRGGVKITTSSSLLTINGKADSLIVNKVNLQPSRGGFEVKTENLKFKHLKLEKLEIDKLHSENLEGEISIGNKVTLNIEREPLEINAFLGDVKFEWDRLQMKGKVRRVFFKGEVFKTSVTT